MARPSFHRAAQYRSTLAVVPSNPAFHLNGSDWTGVFTPLFDYRNRRTHTKTRTSENEREESVNAGRRACAQGVGAGRGGRAWAQGASAVRVGASHVLFSALLFWQQHPAWPTGARAALEDAALQQDEDKARRNGYGGSNGCGGSNVCGGCGGCGCGTGFVAKALCGAWQLYALASV
eukprot:5283902-Pleurochrysis_carterae.AAC.2